MTLQPRTGNTVMLPGQNLRITFWGVRGSCPVFPAPHEVEEFSRQISVMSVFQAVQDIAKKAAADSNTLDIEKILGGPLTQATVEDYQRRLGQPELPTYGGETTCVEVETAEGNIIILDAGSGLRHCALRLVKRWQTKPDGAVHLFCSHEHLDHRSGMAFSRFCFAQPPFHINVYGTGQLLTALDTILGIFSRDLSKTTHFDDPLDYRLMSAKFTGLELRDPLHVAQMGFLHNPPWEVQDISKPVMIGKTKVTAFAVYHGNCPCLGYKIEHNGASFVFCTDHEFRHGTDPDDSRQKLSLQAEERLKEQCMNVNAAYFDGQYFLAEYLGQKGIGSAPPTPRLDWGHSCIEDIIARVQHCRIRHTFIGHHDPDREWPEQVQMDRDLEALGHTYRVELARGDTTLDL